MILHVDMDQFYAAVEQREHPEFSGKPVIVGADPKEGRGRGVVQTCSYEAREFGIRSGMPISRAWKLCPDAIFVRPKFELYISTSNRVMAILRRKAEKFEQWGLDEAFLDVTSKVEGFEKAKQLALTIKKEILRKERLTCSIGIGSNKLVAKIASDYNKPDGITMVRDGEESRFLAPLPVRRLLWIGKKTERQLGKLGIKTIGDLAGFDTLTLREKFGSMASYYFQAARGIDESEVSGKGIAKSISREVTFEEDTSDMNQIFETLNQLCREIHEELEEKKKLFKTITIKIRYGTFRTFTHGKTLSFYSNSLQTFQKTSMKLFEPFLKKNEKVRLIGVKVSNFLSGGKQKTLF
ncbi:MAG: DNA polymerase IV [Candidatus Bathyarchaeota archaeon]|nr:MAG: DNA polymerase IV [Candidatus Bathyarchaeota archaeon]